MKQNKLSFESEKLVVDYISFNIQGLIDRKQVKRIAKYLFFLIFGTNIKFLLDIIFMLQNILLIGVVLKLISQAKMQLNSIALLNNKSLIGIFLI